MRGTLDRLAAQIRTHRRRQIATTDAYKLHQFRSGDGDVDVAVARGVPGQAIYIQERKQPGTELVLEGYRLDACIAKFHETRVLERIVVQGDREITQVPILVADVQGHSDVVRVGQVVTTINRPLRQERQGAIPASRLISSTISCAIGGDGGVHRGVAWSAIGLHHMAGGRQYDSCNRCEPARHPCLVTALHGDTVFSSSCPLPATPATPSPPRVTRKPGWVDSP